MTTLVVQRASDPNRRLVGLNIALQGGRWPVCVEVGIVPVMADGSSDLLYAIDCGAQVPFSLSDGELASVLVRRTIPPSDFQTFIQADFQTSSFPHEWSVGDVTVHLDDPQAGWMRRTADVDVDDSELTHLHPGESVHLTAVVTKLGTAALASRSPTRTRSPRRSHTHLQVRCSGPPTMRIS